MKQLWNTGKEVHAPYPYFTTSARDLLKKFKHVQNRYLRSFH